MNMSIGEIVDRYTICKLKTEKIGLDNSKEIELLVQEIKKYSPEIDYFTEELYKINNNIWGLEADIRQGKIEELGFEEIGRRAVQIRNFNNDRVSMKNSINSKFSSGFIETKIDHGSEQQKSVIITLSTVPERLKNLADNGIRDVVKSLCEQNDTDYEVHFNIPNIYKITNEEYIIPEWLHEYKLKYTHLKIFRVEDIGPPTKFVHTVIRCTNPEVIIITVDDDLIYHTDMVSEHRKYQQQLSDSVICYEGRGITTPVFHDVRDGIVLCVDRIVETNGLQHYKSASYKKKLFTQDFYDYYLGRTLSDDILVSRYFKDKGTKMFVVPYEKDLHLFNSLDLWKVNSGVETFPVIKHANAPSQTGCSHPSILKIQPKFYEPADIGKTTTKTTPSFLTNTTVTEDDMITTNIPHKPSNIIEALRTYNVNSPKIRLGNMHDGGYIINELLVQHTKKLISIGMGGEDSFEQDWVQRYPEKMVEAYDACCECSDLCRKNPEKVNKSIFYVQQNVGYERGNVPLNVIIDGKRDVLLKVDIETAEYKIFDNTHLNDVTGLIIEVHDLHVRENREKFAELMHNQFSNLVLFHVHGNSWGNVFDLNLSKKDGNRGIIVKDFPHVVELTFINKKLISNYELDNGVFPVQNIDYSNKQDVPDIDLYWINAL